MPSRLHPFADDLPIPPVVHARGFPFDRHLSVDSTVRAVTLHAELPPTTVWSYRLSRFFPSFGSSRFGSSRSYLGPTVEVARGDRVAVRWMNRVQSGSGPAALPFEVVKIDSQDPQAGAIAQNLPGSAGALSAVADPMRAALRNLQAALVTHLHGGRTQADSDGWPDDAAAPGQDALHVYGNDQQAAMLWYHDHSNHVTRLRRAAVCAEEERRN